MTKKNEYGLAPTSGEIPLSGNAPVPPDLYHGSSNRELDHVTQKSRTNVAVQTAVAHEAAYAQRLVGALHANGLEVKTRLIDYAEQVTLHERSTLAQQRVEAVIEQEFQLAVRDINSVTANAAAQIAGVVGRGLYPPDEPKKKKGWLG